MPVIRTFLNSSKPGTYTLHVRRKPNQSNFVRLCDQGKNPKWLKGNYGRLIDFLSQIAKHFNLLHLADGLIDHQVCRSVFWCRNPLCALIQPHTCASFWGSSSIGSSGGFIITAHTSPYLFYLPVVVHITATHYKKTLSRVLYAHSQFLCSLASFKLSTLGVRHPSAYRVYSTAMRLDIRAAWCFCSCEQGFHCLFCVHLDV